MTSVKGYFPDWRPQKKTRQLLAQVLEILDRYHDHLPLTVRQIFYLMVAMYGYEKTEKAYKRLGAHLCNARRAELIPFSHIRDDSFVSYQLRHYDDEEDFYGEIRALGEEFTINKLANQDVHIRVHCEASGMLQQLRRVCEPYSVPVYSCSGFDSLTAKYDLKEEISRIRTYQGKATVIMHLGDLDPSGVSIYVREHERGRVGVLGRGL